MKTMEPINEREMFNNFVNALKEELKRSQKRVIIGNITYALAAGITLVGIIVITNKLEKDAA